MTPILRLYVLIAVLFHNAGQANPPEVAFTSPLAVSASQSSELSLHGNHLAGTSRVWIGFPTTTNYLPGATEKESDKKISVTVKPSSDAPVGIYAARAVTQEGVSHPVLIMVDDLPSVREAANHSNRESAQLVQPPLAIDGAGDGPKSDYYCFDALPGQWFTLEIVSSRLGYAFDARIQVFDECGHAIALADDSPGQYGDCHLRFQAKHRQRYFVEVCDANYSSGVRHRYRLRIGDFPLVTSTFPLAVSGVPRRKIGHESSPVTIGFCCVQETFAPPAILSNGSWIDAASIPIATKSRMDGGSAMAKYAISNLPNVVFLDYQPNNCKERALVIESPVAVNGVFREANDRFYYRLPLSAGDRVKILGITRSLGSPTDLQLKIFDSDGKLLESHDDSGLDEASFEFHAADSGAYLLSAEEINGNYGSEYAYRIEVSPARNEFELSAAIDRIIVGIGGVGLLPIQCRRAGYTGAINLSMDGSDAPFCLENSTIQSGENQTLLKLIPRRDLQAGDFRLLRISGEGDADGIKFSRRVSVVEGVRAHLPSLAYPPGELNDQIAVAVARPLPDFFRLRFANDQIFFPRIVGEAYFTVHCIDRIEGFTEAIQVEAIGLPAGFKTSGHERPVGNSKNNEYRFELNGPKSYPVGKHLVTVRGTGTFKGQTKEVVVRDVPLQVIDPLIVSLETPKPAAAAIEIEIRVSAKRFVPRSGGDRKEILCTWVKRPDWLSGSESFTIEAGKNATTVRLSVVSEKAGPSSVGQLKLAAVTSVEGQLVKVESELLELSCPVFPSDTK